MLPPHSVLPSYDIFLDQTSILVDKMAAVIDPATRVNEVHIEGLVSVYVVLLVHSHLVGI